jgi:teichuronic acid biosynthesis glycosyltransferase TuaC
VSRPLHVVSVCRSLPNPDDPSGGVFVLNRLAAMAEEGARLDVIQPIPYLPLAKPLPVWGKDPERVQRGLRVTHAPMLYVPGVLKSADGMWLARSIHHAIARLHRRDPIDVIDAHFAYPEGVGCELVARRLGIPFCVTIRGFENEYVHRAGVGPQMLGAMRRALGCISVSYSLQELAHAHGVSPERTRVIHNAIDARTFSWGDPSQARSALGVDANAKLIVSVGHLVSRKRHHVLIEAFARVQRAAPTAQLVIIGAAAFEPDYPQQLRELARARGVAEFVRFAGNIPPHDVARWLQAADLFALGTAREGCCNAVLEALAVGAPVVTTPVGDNAYFVRDGVNGRITPVDDAAAMTDAILSTLAARWDRPRIAAELAAQAGSWNGVGRRVIEFMHERLAQQAAVQRASA